MKNRIAFISEHASPLASPGGTDSGGQNVYVAELARELAKKGYILDVFTRRDSYQQPRIVKQQPGIRVIHIDAGPAEEIPKEELLVHMDEFADDVLSFIAEENLTYDLVHANFFMSGMVAMQLKERLNIPFVITFHALGHVRRVHQKESDKFPLERLDIEAELVRKADAVIAECPQDMDDLIDYYQAPPEKIKMAPCGFNPEEFYPIDKELSREALGLEPAQKLILQLGRMVPRKGVDNVIRAMALLRSDAAQPRLIIVGGEKEVPGLDTCAEIRRLKALAIETGVEDRVIFAGRKDREQLKIYYDAADVFVTTPWYEPFGITPLEAMACATPVVGSDVGGIKYSVVDGKTGFLVPPRSPELLAEKVSLLLNNEELLTGMGRAALKHVQNNFTWAKVAEQIDALYEEILDVQEQERLEALNVINSAFEDAAMTFRKAANSLNQQIADAALCMATALKKGNKILVCGNGGSAAESQHFAAELVGRFEIPQRRGLPVISLTADTSILTAWSNDFGYDDLFARQVEAYGSAGDILLCLSTSGKSPNIIKAMQTANGMGMLCINMLGKDGGQAVAHGFINLVVPSHSSQRIQEVHLHLIHLLCGLIENRLFIKKGTYTSDEQEKYVPFKIINGNSSSAYVNANDHAGHKYGS
jgi:D-inositol-3-phosphate glycosyltransferase